MTQARATLRVRGCLLAHRGQGAPALRDFSSDKYPAQALGGLLGLLEHALCAVEVLGPAAVDQRAGPAGVGAGQQQWRSEARRID